MTIVYSDKVKQLPDEYVLLKRATEYLVNYVGPTAGLESVEWDRVDDDRGRRRYYTLKLSGFSREVSDVFYPDALWREAHMRFRLVGLWGDLLQAYADVRLKKLQQLVLEGTGSGETDAR
jgi:hypothetical protein